MKRKVDRGTPINEILKESDSVSNVSPKDSDIITNEPQNISTEIPVIPLAEENNGDLVNVDDKLQEQVSDLHPKESGNVGSHNSTTSQIPYRQVGTIKKVRNMLNTDGENQF